MNGMTEKNFGVLIAFLIPGFLFLWGISFWVEGVSSFFAAPIDSQPTIGGFLFTTLAALSVGLILSALRWRVVDLIMEKTGVCRPDMDFGKLSEANTFSAFEGVVLNHYR